MSNKLVFISWSGDKSKKVAEALRKHIRSFIPDVEGFMSKEDIAKGSRGIEEIEKKLSTTAFGIIVVTKDNINAPWINYEAGAIAKGLGAVSVAPLLCDLSVAELGSSPLSNFQALGTQKTEILDLFDAIRDSTSSVIDKEQLKTYFDAFFPQLDSDIKAAVLEEKTLSKELTSEERMLEGIARQISYIRSKLDKPERLLPEKYLAPLMASLGKEDSLAQTLAKQNFMIEVDNDKLKESIRSCADMATELKFDLDCLIDELSKGGNFESEFEDELKEFKRIIALADQLESELIFAG